MEAEKSVTCDQEISLRIRKSGLSIGVGAYKHWKFHFVNNIFPRSLLLVSGFFNSNLVFHTFSDQWQFIQYSEIDLFNVVQFSSIIAHSVSGIEYYQVSAESVNHCGTIFPNSSSISGEISTRKLILPTQLASISRLPIHCGTDLGSSSKSK